MAEPEVVIPPLSADTTPAADVEMDGAEEGENGESTEHGEGDVEPSGLENIEPDILGRVTFLEYASNQRIMRLAHPRELTFLASYLKSPIIELQVGSGDENTILYAHQGLLIQSPFFQEAIAQFSEDAPVCCTALHAHCDTH